MEKILIVDDDHEVREMLGGNIALFGYEYDTAEDGLAAIDKLKGDNFSIVISDIKMPNFDGIQLLQYIRKNYPFVDVIIVTGFGDKYSYVDVIKEGASDFLSKPFNIDELEAKLNRVIREQRLIKELLELTELLKK